MKRYCAIAFLVFLLIFPFCSGTARADGSQKICAKDLNGDGNIDFTSEVANCVTVQGSDFCPLGAANCGSGEMDPMCPTNGTNCPGGTYNPSLNRCERPQIITGYRCPTTGTTYGDQTSCQNACIQTAACQSGTYSVSVSPDQSSSYWFYAGAYRMYCSGSGLYLSANPGGNNRSWTLSGTSCSGDANCGTGGTVTYLLGRGNQLYVYGCQGIYYPEYGTYFPGNCGTLCGILTFDHAVVSGSTRGMSCVLDDASYLSFHDQCDWATWTSIGISGASYQSCPFGNYPCSGGACSTGSACTTVTGCPAGYQLVNSICIAQPQGGLAVTVDSSTHLCEAPVTNSCTGTDFSFDQARDTCVKNADCGEGMLDGGLDLCIFNFGSDQCPAGFVYNALYASCIKDAVCPGEGVLNRLKDLCEAPKEESCQGGFTMDATSSRCLSDISCQGGLYDPVLEKCSVPASSIAPAGYTFNPSLDRFELSPPPCPDGSSYSSTADACSTEAGHTCPTSGTYSASSGKCEASDIPVCSPAGMSYDGASGVCYAASTCLGTGTLNTTTNLCEIAFTPACAGSYSWNPTRSICELDPVCSSGVYNAARDRCEAASNGMACPTGYNWNGSAGYCQANPSCAAGSYNPATDRCEIPAIPNYACSMGGNYSSLAACQSSCFQTALCTIPPINGYGSFDNGDELCVVTTSGSCLYFYRRGGYGYNPGPVCFPGITFSGSIQTNPPGGTHGSIVSLSTIAPTAFGANCLWTGSSFYCMNSEAVYVSGGTVSGGGLHDTFCDIGYCVGGTPPYGNIWIGQTPIRAGWASGNSLILVTTGGEIMTLSFTSTTPVCPLGGYACSGGYCSMPGLCSGPTYSCPGGWTPFGSACYQPAGCSGSGYLNGIADKCEAAGTPTCSSGIYDSSNGVCYQAAACLNGGTLNTPLDKCQIAPSNACPPGYTLNAFAGVCQASPLCSSGLFSPFRDWCEQTPSIGCPRRYTWNGSRGLCESAPAHECPIDGFSYSSALDLCTKPVLCPGGGYLSGDSDICVFQMYSGICPSGFLYDRVSDSCLKPPCPVGTFDPVIQKCVQEPTLTCTNGYTYNTGSGTCQAPPVCDIGSNDGGIDKCAIPGSALCPAQYTFNSLESRCERLTSCSDGSTYSASMDLCTKEPVRQCPTPDYTYQASSRQCVARPVCYVGNFDAVTNRCAGSASGCPLGSQYACLQNPATGILQCSDNACFTISSMPTQNTSADTSSYHNDGTVDPSTGECQGALYIFNGKGKECRPAGISTTFFNCCDSDPGSFLFIQNACGSGDAETVQAVGKGMCHYVGDYCRQKWPLIGCVQRANTYCCFNSKLGRIIHEQGRAQLQQFGQSGNWGGAENPNCRGFTPEEFQMLDFSRIDLSEYFGDIKTKAASEVQLNMQRKVSDFYDQIPRK